MSCLLNLPRCSVFADFKLLQTDRWSLISNTTSPVLHQKNGNARKMLQHEGWEINLKKGLLKCENVKTWGIQRDLPQVLRPDTAFCTQVPPWWEVALRARCFVPLPPAGKGLVLSLTNTVIWLLLSQLAIAASQNLVGFSSTGKDALMLITTTVVVGATTTNQLSPDVRWHHTTLVVTLSLMQCWLYHQMITMAPLSSAGSCIGTNWALHQQIFGVGLMSPVI
jgi:hypothetical protein